MASVVDICNVALARLGDNATIASIDPPEGSAQAEHCARFYPIARDALLELHAWRFATRRETLALLNGAGTWNWTYAYAEPNNVIRLLAILPQSGAADDKTQPYETESGPTGAGIILTHQVTAVARFTTRITDTSKFPPLFVEALTWLLASYLAGPVIKGDTGAALAKSCYQQFLVMLAKATASDANQRKIAPTHSPDWIAQR